MALFHHDPGHDDAMLDVVEEQAQADWRGDGDLTLAREGQVIEL